MAIDQAYDNECTDRRRKEEELRAAALRYQRLAAQKMGELDRLNKKPMTTKYNWHEQLLQPVLDALTERTGVEFEEIHGPFGLRCESPVRAKGKDIWLTFTPGSLKEGSLYIDTGERKDDYPANSIGDMNGLGNVTAEVTDLDVIIRIMQKQDPSVSLL